MSVLRRLCAVLGIAMLGCGVAWSQQYPSKPVRVVIVFAPGGGTDIVGRIVFQKVAELLGQQFVVENRAGAAGMIGAEHVAKSAPDGYTLMVYTQTMLVNAHVYRKTPYDPLKSFVGITPLARLVSMLVVHPSMPVHTTRDFIALAKARPGEIAYGSSGVGGVQHLATSLFASKTGVKLNHIPFKGGAPAVVALMGGEVQATITPIPEIVSHVKSGRLRAIAVSSAKRTAQFPGIPSIGETVKGYDYTSWFGAFAPAGTPRTIVDRLNAEIRKAMADPAVAANLASQTLDPMPMSPEEFGRMLQADYDMLREVVRISGARVE
ncbi:MAG TPA: tripartite tricarboxylate transporter substrate binding protein [Burkholderiales bacterium]|nr:tripartite tricarboxylate transporter substrate binding protein [Burkholderiales bacterium]